MDIAGGTTSPSSGLLALYGAVDGKKLGTIGVSAASMGGPSAASPSPAVSRAGSDQ